MLFQNQFRRRTQRESRPNGPGRCNKFHGLLVDRLQFLPAGIKARQDVLQRQIQAAAGGVGGLGRLPMGVLQRLFGRLLVGGESSERLLADRLVLLFQRGVFRLELGRNVALRAAACSSSVFRLLVAIALVEQSLALTVLLLRRLVSGGEGGADLPFDRHALGHQTDTDRSDSRRGVSGEGVSLIADPLLRVALALGGGQHLRQACNGLEHVPDVRVHRRQVGFLEIAPGRVGPLRIDGGKVVRKVFSANSSFAPAELRSALFMVRVSLSSAAGGDSALSAAVAALGSAGASKEI